MTVETSLLVPGLSSIAGRYDVILCDVWGVIHNGVHVFDGAVKALRSFRREKGGTVVLITNAPRPSEPIVEQLTALGFPRDAYDGIVTSGDVTVDLLDTEKVEQAYHIGPERDHSLFADMNIERVSPEETADIVCTGLFDDTTEVPEDYRAPFEIMQSRGMRMICANPDIVVERGENLIYCAGALASLYESLGGEVVRLGKPYSPVYKLAKRRIEMLRGVETPTERILAIGDGMFTDVKGANGEGIPVLFVTGGIHSDDFGPVDNPDPGKVAERLLGENLQAVAAVPLLCW